jgi:uncharacterized membrane protein YhaH (DUF805 family)
MKWYLKVLNNYATFSGRARRSEFWFLYLIYVLAVFIPGLAVAVRRLHDVGKSGWMYFVVLIPIIGAIWLLVLFFTDSQVGSNKWGENPKEIVS